MDKEKIIQRIKTALATLYASERKVIKNKTNEKTIVAHLVGNLRELFRLDEWDVDTEYNRDGVEAKRDSKGKLIFPDIIIHQRISDRVVDSRGKFFPASNLVALEVKGYWNAEDRYADVQKLRDIRKRYGYQYLFRIELQESVGELIEIN